jgi:predicted kinase
MSLIPLIIISGPPGSGKTTLGRWLTEELRLPFLYKDGLKEILYDTLGWSDREWSMKLGVASISLLYYTLEVELKAGNGCVVESNFLTEYATPRLLELKQRYPFRVFQIQCYTDNEALFQRLQARAASAKRHPGHVESSILAELTPATLVSRYEPLEIGGELLWLDTTDFAQVDYTRISAQVRLFLETS